MVMGMPMAMIVAVRVIMPVLMGMTAGRVRRLRVQVATPEPEVESFPGQVNSAVIAFRLAAAPIFRSALAACVLNCPENITE